MLRSLGILSNILLILLLNFVVAASYSNQSTLSVSISSEQLSAGIYTTTGSFVDCGSYEASVIAAAAVTSPNPTNQVKPTLVPASITAAAPTPEPFVAYWCNSWGNLSPTDPEEHPEAIGGYFYGLNVSAHDTCLSLEQADYSSWAASASPKPAGDNYTPPAWSPVMTPPCCDNFCNIQASAVQLYYWPTSTGVPNVTTTVDATGFTYTYPSIYLVYNDVSASGDCGIVGPTYASLTQSYALSEIATEVYNGGFGDADRLNPNDLWSNCSTLATPFSNLEPACETSAGGPASQPGGLAASAPCMSQVNQYELMQGFDQIHCHPQIKYPVGLQSAVPAWSSCHAGNFASVYDPPRTLSPASAMAPVQTRPLDPPVSAAPASVVAQPAASKTPPPNGVGNDPQDPDPPSSGDPLSSGEPPNADPPPSQDPPGDPKDPSQHSSTIPTVPNLGGQGLPADSVDPGSAIKPGATVVQSQGQQGIVDPAASDVVAGGEPQIPAVGSSPTSPTVNDDPAAIVPFSTTIQGHTIQAASSPRVVVVDGQSMTRGGAPIVVAGTTVAVHSNGDLVLGTSTIQNIVPNPAPSPESPSPPPIITAAGHAVTALPNGFAIAGTILTPNAPAITVAGTPISVGNSALVVGSSTIPLPTLVSAPIITSASQPIAVLPNGKVVIAGTTLAPNAPAITVAGTSISLGTDGLIVGTSTIPISSLATAPVITAAGKSVTLLPDGSVIVAGIAVTPNAPAVTIAGIPISLGANSLVVGTSTVSLSFMPLPTTITIGGQTFPLSQAADDIVLAGTTLHIGQSATIAGTAVTLGSSGLVIGTSTIPLRNIASAPAQGGIGGLIYSGLNGGLGMPSSMGAAGSNSTQSNGTGAAGGTGTFLGEGGRVGIRWEIVVGSILWLCLVAV